MCLYNVVYLQFACYGVVQCWLFQRAGKVKAEKYCWYILTVSTIAQMCAALSTQGIGVLAGFLQHDFGLSNSKVGMLIGVLNIVPIFGLFFAGKLLDHIGERIPIFMGMLIISASMLLMSSAHNYWVLLLALFFSGIGYSPIQPGGSKAIYSWFPYKLRGLAIGIRQAALPLGGAISAVLYPYLIKYSDWRTATAFGSLAVLTGGILFYIVYRNNSSINISPKDTQIILWNGVLAKSSFIRISTIGVILISVQTAMLTFWMLFLEHRFHIPLLSSAWYLFAMQISGAAGRIIISTLGNRINNGHHKALFVTMIMIVLGLLTIIYIPTNTKSYVIMLDSCLLGFFGFGWYGSWIICLLKESQVENIGSILGLSMTFNQIAIVLTPLLFGFLTDTSGSFQFSWLFIIGILSLVLFF